MSLKSIAQQLVVVDQKSMPEMINHIGNDVIPIVPLEVSMDAGNEHVGDEHADHEPAELHVLDPQNDDIVIEIGELPGAPPGTTDPHEEPTLEVEDTSTNDENDAKKSKKNEKWDWESKGPHGFVAWIKTRIDDVPKHSGYDSAGLERAIFFMEKLDSEISKAMRLDLDGELDANKIEEVRSKIDEGLSRLQDRLDKVRKTSKTRRKKKSEYSSNDELIKKGQKITGVQGVFITADVLTSRIAKVCINGMISGGHDIEDIFQKQSEKYKLDDREKARVIELLDCMGYAMRQDRGYLPDEDVDETSSDNFDWGANFRG